MGSEMCIRDRHGAALVVVDIPAQGLEERAKQLVAELRLVVAAGQIGVAVLVEAVDQTFDGVRRSCTHYRRGYGVLSRSQAERRGRCPVRRAGGRRRVLSAEQGRVPEPEQGQVLALEWGPVLGLERRQVWIATEN